MSMDALPPDIDPGRKLWLDGMSTREMLIYNTATLLEMRGCMGVVKKKLDKHDKAIEKHGNLIVGFYIALCILALVGSIVALSRGG